MFSMHNAKNKDIHSKIKCELKTFNSLNQFCIQYLFIEGNINIDNKLTDNETKLEILDLLFRRFLNIINPRHFNLNDTQNFISTYL